MISKHWTGIFFPGSRGSRLNLTVPRNLVQINVYNKSVKKPPKNCPFTGQPGINYLISGGKKKKKRLKINRTHICLAPFHIIPKTWNFVFTFISICVDPSSHVLCTSCNTL